MLLKHLKFPSLSPGVWPFASLRLWLLQIVNNFLPEVFTLTSQEHLLPISKVVPSMSGSRWFGCLPSFLRRPSSFPVYVFRSLMIKMSPLSLHFINISFSFQKQSLFVVMVGVVLLGGIEAPQRKKSFCVLY